MERATFRRLSTPPSVAPRQLRMDLLGGTFRSNGDYDLIPFERLGVEQQEALANLASDPDFYGVLKHSKPTDSKTTDGRGLRSVCRDTALLFLTLRTPGPLPSYVFRGDNEGLTQAISKLVADEILEFKHDGGFVTGVDAHRLVYGDEDPKATNDTIADLSVAALQHAQLLDLDDPGRLSARIYFYNRLPASHEMKKRFPSASAVARQLGVDPDNTSSGVMHRWSVAEKEGWRYFRKRHLSRHHASGGSNYKLYVSPLPPDVINVFEISERVFAELNVSQFKLGYDLYGLLRPDKLVAYFPTSEELDNVATKMQRELNGLAGHGVPFTAPISQNGLISWGMDPPKSYLNLPWRERESWRLWVTNRLAVALLAAKHSGKSRPWQFALDRMSLEGVDIGSWTPSPEVYERT